ncbi:MAG: hypothetical protein HYS20_02685 [Rhodocyclales bacterium]|nr:hypothetical protein [Rhodocyclales bacterium]
MKTPKLLPWYARKADITLERATVLWHKAVRRATKETGWVGTSEYYDEAMRAFLELLALEPRTLCAPGVAPMLRQQNRVWRLPLTAMEDVMCAVASSWQRQTGFPRKAA